MLKAIDIHTHLFDVAFGGHPPTDGAIPGGWMLIRLFEVSGFTYLIRRPGWWMQRMEQSLGVQIGKRLSCGSQPDDLHRAMDRAAVGMAVVHPVYPYVTTDDILKVCDHRSLFAFAAPPLDHPDMLTETEKMLDQGCLGVKIHPLVQQRPLDDPAYLDLFELCALRGVPMLTHFGGSGRMFRSGNPIPPLTVPAIRRLASHRKDGRLIIGHAGLWQNEEVLAGVRGLDEVYLETSFQGSRFITRAVKQLGAERLLFGSDFPIGNPLRARRAVDQAAIPDTEKELILRRNAINLLGFGRVYSRSEDGAEGSVYES